jgi:hypothetical protein
MRMISLSFDLAITDSEVSVDDELMAILSPYLSLKMLRKVDQLSHTADAMHLCP